jgi:hypothetical protein
MRLRTHARDKRPWALPSFDVDHFKAFNDAFGHAIGDTALKLIVDAVAAVIRNVGMFGRIEGKSSPSSAMSRTPPVRGRWPSRCAPVWNHARRCATPLAIR